MFDIIDVRELFTKYTPRKDCAGINFDPDLRHGNIIFIKTTDGIHYSLSKVLFVQIVEDMAIIQDEEFISLYK